MGAGYHGSFGYANGEKKHQKYIESSKKSSENLIDKNLVSEMEKIKSNSLKKT